MRATGVYISTGAFLWQRRAGTFLWRAKMNRSQLAYAMILLVAADAVIRSRRITKSYVSGLLGSRTGEPAINGYWAGTGTPDMLRALHAHTWVDPAWPKTHRWVSSGYLFYPGTLCSAVCAWYEAGRLHREGDLPARLSLTWSLWYERQWYKNGELHRDMGKPAVITETAEGQWVRLSWFVYGKLHRDNGKIAHIRLSHVVWDNIVVFATRGRTKQVKWYLLPSEIQECL